MAITTLELPIGNTTARGFSEQEGRPVYEYVDGKRTETQRTDSKGRPLFRHSVAIVMEGTDPEQTTALLPTSAPVGVLTELAFTPDTTVIVRGARDGFGLSVTITGELAQGKRD